MKRKNDADYVKTIGWRLYDCRKRMNLSQEEIGIRIGVAKSVISEYENNKRSLTIPVVNAFVSVFGVTSDYLLYGTKAADVLDPDIAYAVELLKEIKTEKGRKAAIEHIKIVKMMDS